MNISEQPKLTREMLEEFTIFDNFFVSKNGKSYNIGCIVDGYAMFDEDCNETSFRDFNDIWENCQIDGAYLRDMLDDLEWYFF